VETPCWICVVNFVALDLLGKEYVFNELRPSLIKLKSKDESKVLQKWLQLDYRRQQEGIGVGLPSHKFWSLRIESWIGGALISVTETSIGRGSLKQKGTDTSSLDPLTPKRHFWDDASNFMYARLLFATLYDAQFFCLYAAQSVWPAGGLQQCNCPIEHLMLPTPILL